MNLLTARKLAVDKWRGFKRLVNDNYAGWTRVIEEVNTSCGFCNYVDDKHGLLNGSRQCGYCPAQKICQDHDGIFRAISEQVTLLNITNSLNERAIKKRCEMLSDLFDEIIDALNDIDIRVFVQRSLEDFL